MYVLKQKKKMESLKKIVYMYMYIRVITEKKYIIYQTPKKK